MADVQMRTAIVPVWLNRAYYQRAHTGAHDAALLWNVLVRGFVANGMPGVRPVKPTLNDTGTA